MSKLVKLIPLDQDMEPIGIWRRIRAVVARGMNQKMTRTGLVFSLATAVVALAAFSSANNLLFLILAAMLATLMISGLVSRLSLSALAVDLFLPQHLCANRKFGGRIEVLNEKRWMASFSINLAGYGKNPVAQSLYFPFIAPCGVIDRPVELYFDRRGSYAANSFRFSTRFPFGFAERRMTVVVKRDVLVYPPLDAQPGFEGLLAEVSGEMESRRRGIGSDFYRLRPYESGESARHVDWKATAHTRALQIREFTKDHDRFVAVHLDIDSDADWLEWSINCSAYVVWNLSSQETRVRFRTQEVDIQTPEDGDAYTILGYLATVRPKRGVLAPILIDRALHDRTLFHIVFTRTPERLSAAGWDLSSNNVMLVDPARAAGYRIEPVSSKTERSIPE